MIELLTSFSLTQIIIFVFLLLFAIKELITIVEFFYKKIKDALNKESSDKNLIETIHDKIVKLEQEIKEQKDRDAAFSEKLKFLEEDAKERKKQENIALQLQESLSNRLDKQQEILTLLTDSDRDDIRSWIVHQYHFFCENQKWIDDFSMDALEKRYSHYQREGGNSYITSLMTQLRELPRHPQ